MSEKMPSTLVARLSEGCAFGLGLRAEGCFVRGEARGGLGHHRAEWGGEIDFAEDSFAGYDAEFGADQGKGAHCFVARGRHGVPSGIDGSRWTTDYKTTGCLLSWRINHTPILKIGIPPGNFMIP